jgi:hypothetical protein
MEGTKKVTKPREDGTALRLKKMGVTMRNDDLRKNKTAFGIIDAQSIQNADTAGARRKVSGIKCTRGLPHAAAVKKGWRLRR